MSALMSALISALAMVALAGPDVAGLERTVEAHDGAVVRVSATEPNLVEAGEGRVSAFVFTEGAVTETIDSEAGVVYFRPLVQEPLSGFVETESEGGARTRYSLIIVADEDLPAQRIVLGAVESSSKEVPLASYEPTAGAHVTRIKDLVRELASDTSLGLASAGVVVQDFGGMVLTKAASVRRGSLVGELLYVENRGDEPRRVEETLLNAGPGVLAVAVLSETVGPGQAVEAYLIRAASVSDEERL